MQNSEKQQFLRKKIISQGYDGSKFIKYLEDQNQKTTDLDKWDMKDLKSAVDLFREKEDANDNDDSISSAEAEVKDKLFGKKVPKKKEDQSSEEESSEDESPKKQKKTKDSSPGNDNDDNNLENQDDGTPGEENQKKSQKMTKTAPTMEKTVLVDCDQISFSISKPQIIKGNMFTKSFTIYTIKTHPFEWEVTRRYSDFVWLYDCLVKRFSSHFVSS